MALFGNTVESSKNYTKRAVFFMAVLERWVKDTAFHFKFSRRLIKKIVGTQVHIISHPKSGRTWLRVLLGKALCEHFNIDEKWLLDTYKLTFLANILPTQFTHDRSEIKIGSNWNELESDKSNYRNKKVVFIIRDPRDVLVSTYFHATKRVNALYGVNEDFGSISEFVRSDQYGIRKIIAFYKVWFDNQTLPRDFLLIRYEDMHKETAACLRSVLEFIGVKNISEETIINAVNFSRFENMKKLERSEQFQSRMLKAADPNDEESYKVRRGKVGGYSDYISQQDLEFIEQVIVEAGNPFCYD